MGATLHHGAWASHCSGFSCCGAQALGMQASVVAARGLSSCSMHALECPGFSSCGMGSVVVAHGLQSTGSVAVAYGLSCSAACEILPDQGLNPCPLHWQVDSQPLHHQRSPPFCSSNTPNPFLPQGLCTCCSLSWTIPVSSVGIWSLSFPSSGLSSSRKSFQPGLAEKAYLPFLVFLLLL